MRSPEDLLWSSVSVDSQYEGSFGEDGRGVITQDFVTDSSADIPRMMTYRLLDGIRGETSAKTSMSQGVMGDFRKGKYYPSHQIVDFYHRYKEDIRYLADMELNCTRFSICWIRILPTSMEEKPDKKGLGSHEMVADECLRYDIQLLITTCHGELPTYLAEHYQGQMGHVAIDCYVKLCRALLERLGGGVKYWLTFSEVSIPNGYNHLGTTDCTMTAIYRYTHHMFVASALAVKLGYEMMPGALFDTIYAAGPVYVRTCRLRDMFVQMTIHRRALLYIDVTAREEYPVWRADFSRDNGAELVIKPRDKKVLSQGTADYISFSTYRSTTCMTDSGLKMNVFSFDPNPYLEATPWGWIIGPLGLRYVLNELWNCYQLLLFIIENGLSVANEPDEDFWMEDDYRINYLKDHFKATKDTVRLDGIPVLGYTIWGGIGLVSLSTGEAKRWYGRVYADMDDKEKEARNDILRKAFAG